MADHPMNRLSRRERQIMDILYQRGRASVMDVFGAVPDAASYSAVRALLAVLERKGHVRHTKEGPRYLYTPRRRRERVGRAALGRVLRTFYDGSLEKAVAALLDVSQRELTDEEMNSIAQLIDRARKEGR